jgi:hypothetical protein
MTLPRFAVAGLVLLAALTAPAAARAGSIAYIDNGEVWISSLDGAKKARLSAGEGDWREVAAADDGHVLGVRLQSGKISQLSNIQLWGANGAVLSQGPLSYASRGWSSYVAPLGLDLTSDGTFLAYGYSGYTGIVPNATFYSGHNVILSDNKTLIQPIGQGGYKWPSLIGRRVVAAEGSRIVVQNAGAGNPFATQWTTLLDVGGIPGMELRRTDIAATGRLVAIELDATDPAPDKIAVVSIAGLDTPVTFPAAVDCFLPATGNAVDVTLSQDGTRIAWKDADGLKSAGVPTTDADPCVLSSPPVLISPTGSSPSIGGLDVGVLLPVPPAGGGGPAPSTGATPPTISLTLPSKLKATALTSRKGFTVEVRVPAAGKVTVTGAVPASKLGMKGSKPVTVVSGSATAKRAGAVRIKLRATAKARRSAKRLRGAKLTLRVVQGATRTARTVTLR